MKILNGVGRKSIRHSNLFNVLYLPHAHSLSEGFGTTWRGDAQQLFDGCIIPSFSNESNSAFVTEILSGDKRRG